MIAPHITCKPQKLPLELRTFPHWVVWKLLPDPTPNDPKHTKKMPYSPVTGIEAKASCPETWGTYEQAVAAFKKGGYAGLGFEFHTDDPFMGFDIDKCRDIGTGEITEEAQWAVEMARTYTDISQSGTGLKGIAKGNKINGTKCKVGDYEMYDHGRFFALTGCRLPNTEPDIQDREKEFAALYSVWFPEKEQAKKTQIYQRSTNPISLSDSELLEKASRSKNGSAFDKLWRGDTSDYANRENEGRSEGDMALCTRLAFWTDKDPIRIDSLFRQSGLMRDKWDERRGAQTYGEMTVQRAVALCSEGYTEPILSNNLDSITECLEEKKADPKILTYQAWQKRGKRLNAAKSKFDDEFKWQSGDWWNSAKEGSEWNGRFTFLKMTFGVNLARQVQNWASVCVHWTPQERRRDRPFWLHTELANQPDEVKKKIMDRSWETTKRSAIREELGIKNPTPTKQWFTIFKQAFGDNVCKKIAAIIQNDPSAARPAFDVFQEMIAPKQATTEGINHRMNDETCREEARRNIAKISVQADNTKEPSKSLTTEIKNLLKIVDCDDSDIVTFHAGVKSEEEEDPYADAV